MAYDSDRQYAEEILKIIEKGGSADQVNWLLNERIEKQQDLGMNAYDDVYRQAMDYINKIRKNNGYNALKASDNVNYAALAEEILAGGEDTDRYDQDLASVLSQGSAKMSTGKYDQYRDTVSPTAGIPYYGEGSVHEQANQRLFDKALEDAQKNYPYLSGGYAYAIPALDAARAANGGTVGAGQGIVNGQVVSGARAGVGTERERQNELRDQAWDYINETNAVTRVPVNGEESSWVKSNTGNAYDEAAKLLEEADDQKGMEAVQIDRENWLKTNLTGRRQPPENNTPVYGVYGGASGARLYGGTVAGGSVTGSGSVAGSTDQDQGTMDFEERMNALRAARAAQTKYLTDSVYNAIPYAGYEGLPGQMGMGDTAKKRGGTAELPVQPKPMPLPNGTQIDRPANLTGSGYVDGFAADQSAGITAEQKIAGYQKTISDLTAAGDYAGASAARVEYEQYLASLERQAREEAMRALMG